MTIQTGRMSRKDGAVSVEHPLKAALADHQGLSWTEGARS